MTFLLFRWMSWFALVPLGCIIVMQPLYWYLTRRFGQTENKIMELKDKRVKIINELLQGMLIVKAFAWEYRMRDKVMKIRGDEINQVRKFQYNLVNFKSNPIQFKSNPIQSNSIQFNPIQFNSIQFNSIQFNQKFQINNY